MALFRAWQGRLPGEKPSNGRIVIHPVCTARIRLERVQMRLVLAVVFLNQMFTGLAAVASEGAVKPQSCSYAPVIVDAADFVLTEPLIKPPIWRDRFGDDAAYWKIRYGGLDYDAGAALLRQLKRGSSRLSVCLS
jgi:hypothetical protein